MMSWTRGLQIADLPKAEQNVVDVIRGLDVNVSTSGFPCNFLARGRLTLSNDTDDGQCHIVDFELLPTALVPVGMRQKHSEEQHRKIASALVQLRYLRRVVLPDASKANVARLRRGLPDCVLFTRLEDARPYSAKVAFTAVDGTS
jgi:hypothetical protein